MRFVVQVAILIATGCIMVQCNLRAVSPWGPGVTAIERNGGAPLYAGFDIASYTFFTSHRSFGVSAGHRAYGTAVVD